MRIIQSIWQQAAEEKEICLDRWRLLADPTDIVFLDIETTGFSRLYDSIYLVGMVYYEKDAGAEGNFTVKQFLAGSLAEEGELLKRALEELRRFKVCITYNGDMFDLPFLEERAKRLHIWNTEDEQLAEKRKSIDLLRLYRRHQAFFGWPNMKLKTIEAFLGLDRQDPFDGGQLIEVFYEYARTDDERLETVLLLHNYEDVCYLPQLLLVQEFLLQLKQGAIEKVSYEQEALQIFWDKPFSLSHIADTALNNKKRKAPDYPKARFIFEAGSSCCKIVLPVCEEKVYYYLPNAKDYYFIPEQGEIVHKSLAYDVPPSERRKARPAECVLPGEGIFLQVLPASAGLRHYQKTYKAAEIYVEKTELQQWLEEETPQVTADWVRQFFELL